MGYYTRYSLDLVVPNTASYEPETVIEQLLCDCENATWALEEDGTSKSETKWYDWHKDMKAFSLKYPETVFVLKGEGEETGDLWVCYFYNGKSQEEPAQIFYGHFDPEKLK